MSRILFILVFYIQISLLNAQTTFLKNDQESVDFKTCCLRNYFIKTNGNYLVAFIETHAIEGGRVSISEFDTLGKLLNVISYYPQPSQIINHNSLTIINDTVFSYSAFFEPFGTSNFQTLFYNIDNKSILKQLTPLASLKNTNRINDTLFSGLMCTREIENQIYINENCSTLIYKSLLDTIQVFEYADFVDVDYLGNYYLAIKNNNIYNLKKFSHTGNFLAQKTLVLDLEQNIEAIKAVDEKLLVYYRDIDSVTFNFSYKLICLDENLNELWQISGSNLNEISNGLTMVKNMKNFPITVSITYFEREPLSFYSGLYKLKESGVLEKINEYKIDNEDIFIGQRNFSFSPTFQTPDGGYFGGASHWNSPYQFNIMKTDSLGRVFESDYLGGITFTGISENDVLFTPNQIALYPNPNNGQFRMGNEELGVVEVYNLQGQKVHSQRVAQVNELINLIQPKSGVYLLRFIQENGTVKNAKFVVE